MNVEKLGKRYFFCLFTEAIQKAVSVLSLFKSGVIFWMNLLISLIIIVSVSFIILPDSLQMYKYLLIYYFSVVHSAWVIIVLMICNAGLTMVCRGICQWYGKGLDWHIKQQGKKQQIKAAAGYWSHAVPSLSFSNMNQNVISPCGKYRCCLIFGLVLSHVDTLLIRKIAVQVVSRSSK